MKRIISELVPSELISLDITMEELIFLLLKYLKGWTEISLTNNQGYDKDKLIFYDAFIGSIIRKSEELIKLYPELKKDSFIQSWLYQGKLYRVIHRNIVENKRNKRGYSCRMPKVEYHEMITHWTKDRSFKALKHKLSETDKYIILETDTKDRLAFDVNKFRKIHNEEELYTQDEDEVIFLMYKDYIKEYPPMSIKQFNDMIN